MKFTKYEGLGNDFLVVEGSDGSAVPPGQAQQVCDRHFGVGGDGVLIVTPPRTPGARAAMVVINADGSRPEMCGNGLRCVALHLARSAGEARATFVVDTDAGPRECEVAVDSGGRSGQVRLQLGTARLLGTLEVPEGDTPRSLVHVDIGNPHAILFDAPHDAAAIDAYAPRVAASVPGGLNVEFVQTRGPRAFDLVVHERGVGRTLACGTGAGATAVAAVHAGRAERNTPLVLHLPGGPLEITVLDDDAVMMRGPARVVFDGDVPVLDREAAAP